ncbi:unnamed protein product [Triticum turgidum subsp. durum]|uniref:NB-ARC domain-containing protein n=1 Tax=Triticum turgidum subsp. durum TaxID=4567 RepID=A0A9R0V548_TRITD|nr:unnamed protein product [Triticum turgidum subsp. durum]
MAAAVGTAQLLLGKVLTKLSDERVASYVASSELGLDSQKIKDGLMHTAGLLQHAHGRGTTDIPGLQDLLENLSKKADEAEQLLNTLQYFMIQDQLDSTQLVKPDLGDGLKVNKVHARHTLGNCLPCFSCSCTSSPQNGTKSDSSDLVDELAFDSVSMSIKIKSVLEETHSICVQVSDLLAIPNHTNSPTTAITIPHTMSFIGSTIAYGALYGRDAISEETIDVITSCDETLSVLPVVGPPGIGKTTFIRLLYNSVRIKDQFTVIFWVCVQADFNVLELTQNIHRCIPATENEESISVANEVANLDQLQISIARILKSKRFLVVLDDVWPCKSDEWNTLLAPFTKGEAKGSMVLVTTRFNSVAQMVKTMDPIMLHGLDPNVFLRFFEACIFDHLDKPGHYEDELIDIARDIAGKLQGSPLAAKTLGRLLRTNLSREHWITVLENEEWKNTQGNRDIMSTLYMSYDYLPFVLQKCFSYFALFPKDHRFSSLEMNRFWIALGIIDSTNLADNSYLEELVGNGFLMRDGINYVMHDLIHELSLRVSAQECHNISISDFKADAVPPSVRHLSVTLKNRYDENFRKEMSKLERRIEIANLRTLMIFSEYEERTSDILKDTFKELNNLNVLFIVVKSLDDLPKNFSKLIHLQHLKLGSPYGIEITLPSTLSMFYHLKFLDLDDWHGSSNLPKDINRLVNLQAFLAKKELHSSVPEVGKMKYLRELKEFCVRKESVGFELVELGKMTELGGELRICNLENVVTKEEATSARLMSKRNMGALTLVWGKGQQDTGSDILDGLQPHANLRALGIINHDGAAGPSWLCPDISVKNLESLHLEGVHWGTLPPLGQLEHLKELSLKSISGLRQLGPDYGGNKGKSFIHLWRIVIYDMPELVEWVVEPDSQLFPRLRTIMCTYCPNLCVMPFSKLSCAKLRNLHIDDCPKLSLLSMPLCSTLQELSVVESGSRKLTYSQKVLVICGYNGGLDFHNLDKVEHMSIADISHISLTDVNNPKSLRRTAMGGRNSMSYEDLDGRVVFHSVQNEDHVERVIRFPSSSSLQTLSISGCAGMVLLPTGDGEQIQATALLHSVTIFRCVKLFSRWPMGETGGEPQTMKPFPASLKKLGISSESSIQSMALLSNLTSLTHLTLQDCVKLTVDGFNPLITVNLKVLVVFNCRWDKSCPESIAADLLSEVASSRKMPAGSFQLEQLKVDSISAVLVTPICNLVATTIHTLIFCHDHRIKSFTEEQEKALQLLTSLRHLTFDGCGALQSLPQGLHRLSSLKDIEVRWCPEMQSMPKEGFPVSLRTLRIRPCNTEVKEQIENLRRASPGLSVRYE